MARLVLAVLGISASAHAAAAEPWQCETRSDRPAAEIVVPLANEDDVSDWPKEGVKLLPGESLCLTGRADESGDIQQLRLVAPSSEQPAFVIELRLDRGDATRLTVRHTGKQWLYFDTLQLVTAQDIALHALQASVGPGTAYVEPMPAAVRKLLVHSFRVGSAPELTTGERNRLLHRDTSKLNMSVTFGFWGGERWLRLPELEHALSAEGVGPFDRVGVMGGLDLDFTFGRVRGGVGIGAGGRSARIKASGNELSTWFSEVLFTAGYDVLRYDQFHAFVASGFGVGTLYVDRPPGSSVFPDLQPWEGNRVKGQSFEVPFDVGTDYFFPFGRASATEKWVLQFGSRLGWVQQVGSSDWSTDEKHSRDLGGPPWDLSGLRARLVLGIGAQNGW